MGSKIYSKAELKQMTRLQVYKAAKAASVPFKQGDDPAELIPKILVAQGSSETESSSTPKSSDRTETVMVVSGAAVSHVAVAGRSVKDVRTAMRDRLNIGSDAKARVNGSEVGGDVVLKAGDELEFVKPAGSKASF